jgi:hypothetical protein
MIRMQQHRYKTLTVLFLTILCLFMSTVIVTARLHDDRYPPTITNSISLDAKLRFLRRNPQLFGARTVFAGSSMCFNNVDVAYLNQRLPQAAPFVNISAWGLQIDSTGAFLDFFLEHAQNVRNVVLVGQLVDFRSSRKGSLFDREEVWAYLSGKENLLFTVRHFNMLKCLEDWRTFDSLARTNQQYDGLRFDETGTVTLDIPQADLNWKRWNTYGLDSETNAFAFRELEKLCCALHSRGIRFIFVVTPVRQAYLQHINSFHALEAFKGQVRNIVSHNDGQFVDADGQLHLKDDCFIDMMHLNQHGARKVAELLKPLL